MTTVHSITHKPFEAFFVQIHLIWLNLLHLQQESRDASNMSMRLTEVRFNHPITIFLKLLFLNVLFFLKSLDRLASPKPKQRRLQFPETPSTLR